MSGIIVSDGTPVTLTSGLNGGNVTFANSPTPGGTLVVEPGAIGVSTSVSAGVTSVISAYLGGNIEGFRPGDTIVISNLEQLYADLDKAPSAAANNALFNSDISIAAANGVAFYVKPGGYVTSNNLFINFELSTLEPVIEPYFGLIDEALFGSSTLTGTLTIAAVTDMSGSFVNGVITSAQTISAACFAAGTRIATATGGTKGEVKVETLRVGDVVRTMSGKMRPITWVGHRDIDITRHPKPESVRPVRVRAGALAEQIPARDLILSPDHALYLEGRLVPVKDLIDGDLIAPMTGAQKVTYFHIELDGHDILLANGAPAESYLDTGNRFMFEDAGAPMILHPDLMAVFRDVKGCAPLCTDGADLAKIRSVLHRRKQALGFRMQAATPWLKHPQMILSAIEPEPGLLLFHLPGQDITFMLMTGAFVPAYIDPSSADHRQLGMCIGHVTLDGKRLAVEDVIDQADRYPRAEHDLGIWTKGDVTLSLPHPGTELVIGYTALPIMWRRAA
ncbi:MAG: hypothetical protein B7Z78_01355 [Rhodospirillales bacterium 20-60-12]|nr:MAG: hypothetical protein B7Z78_01355 [Rhodospirillales bacterium 20-60-12]HQT67369.1 Hint domain-containing protein [Acetobacteraceae bacterium]